MYSSILINRSAFTSTQERRCNDLYTPRYKHMDSFEASINAATNAVTSISLGFKAGIYEIYRLMSCVSWHKYHTKALS